MPSEEHRGHNPDPAVGSVCASGSRCGTEHRDLDREAQEESEEDPPLQVRQARSAWYA